MPVNEYREDFVSLIPALHLLINLGYEYLPSSEELTARNFKPSKVILEDILREQLKKINKISFKCNEYPFSDSNIENAVRAVSDIPFDSLLTTNEQVYDLLTLGKSFEETIEGYKRSYTVQYIDWNNIDNNLFHVCDEFIVERRHSHQTRRPDIVLFVNGIPLAVIECKRPDLRDAVKQGISQHLRNQGVDEIPNLFIYSQLLLSVSQNNASFATAGTAEKFWSIWKEDYSDKEQKILQHNVNMRLSDQEEETLFSERENWEINKVKEIWNSGIRLPSVQDKLIYSILRPDRLLEITKYFIVYDNKIKKAARYQQYFAIKKTLERITDIKGDEKRKGGVIWHTTGTGKSIAMVLLAKSISLEPSIIDPKIILVTDRVDLDDQIYKTFRACGKEVKRATSGENLFYLLEENKATIITTIINKFEAGLRKKKTKALSRNIFVLVDESHRTQYGVSHASMKRVFPNACYIGFTGTPLLKREKSTAYKFGGFIHTYTMDQAVNDNAISRLIYEGRMSELRGNKAQLDKWFKRITLDLTEEQKTDLKKKFRREEELTKSDERIQEITYDIIQHFTNTYKGTGLKGQFAVSSRYMALRYKKYFDAFGGISTEVIMSPPDTREGYEDVDESEIPEVQRFWKSMMDKYGNPDKYQTSIINAFKFSDEPEIIIVIDKLLTGFDAPRNTVLYIDKRLKEHNILQAISRVNRLYEGKEHGLIIDYRGVFGELNEAIEIYKALEKEGFEKEDIKGTITNILDEIKQLPQYHTNVWEVFKEVENRRDVEAMQLHLEPEDIREKFYEHLKTFAKTLQLALGNPRFQEDTPEKTKKIYKDDFKMFLSLKNSVKQRFGETVDYSTYEKQIRNMVNKYIGASEVRKIVEPVDLFSIEAFERELEGIEGDAAKADTIASRMKKTATENMYTDPILYKKLSEVISEAIAEHRARRLSDAEYLERMRDILNDLRDKGNSDIPEPLKNNDEARAYYRVIVEQLSPILDKNINIKEFCTDIGLKCHSIIDNLKKRDWVYDRDIINKMWNEMEDFMFNMKEQYNLKLELTIIDKIIEDTIEIAKNRELYY